MASPKRNRNRHAEWREIFGIVVEAYQHIATTNGTLGSMDYEKALSDSKGTRCTKIVRPSMSDFRCDVEIAARRALDKEELDFFNQYYRACVHPDDFPKDDTFVNTNLTVQSKVGRMFQSRRIYPLGAYFRAKDVRV